MNVNKQTREYIALGVLLVVLGIAVVFFLQGNKPQQNTKKPPDTRTEQAKATPASSKTTANSKSWVTEEKARISGLVAEVQGGRNPFKDMMAPAPVPAPDPTPAPQPGGDPIPPGGQLYGRPSSDFPGGPLQIDVERTVTLRWITWQDAAAALKQENITDVIVTPGKKSGTTRFKGPDVSVQDALAVIDQLDVEPPAPDFQLRGVITTASSNMAVISVNGKTYSLYEGDIVPGVGWTVKTVTPASVTLTKKGYTSVTRRLAGGKA